MAIPPLDKLGGSGDPSDATAYEVLRAMKEVARHLWGDTSLVGRHVALAAVGKVGRARLPCAFGGILNTGTIPELRCAAVVRSANNQLAAARRIFDTVTSVLNVAEEDGMTTAEAADRRAQDRMAALSAVHHIRIPT